MYKNADNVGVGRVQWGIPKGYPHPPLPPPGGGGGGGSKNRARCAVVQQRKNPAVRQRGYCITIVYLPIVIQALTAASVLTLTLCLAQIAFSSIFALTSTYTAERSRLTVTALVIGVLLR